jgi:hypothetical protein
MKTKFFSYAFFQKDVGRQHIFKEYKRGETGSVSLCGMIYPVHHENFYPIKFIHIEGEDQKKDCCKSCLRIHQKLIQN